MKKPGSRVGCHGHRSVGEPASWQFPRAAFTRRFPCVRRGSRLSAAQNPPPVFPRKTSAGGFGLAQGIAFTEEHALFRFRQFLHRFDDFGDGAHGPKLWHAPAVSGKEMKQFGIRSLSTQNRAYRDQRASNEVAIVSQVRSGLPKRN